MATTESFPKRREKEGASREIRGSKLEQLMPLLEDEAEKLRTRGFPLTDDLRIDPLAFKGTYTVDDIQRDARRVYEREGQFKKGGDIGKLLEVVKTLAFNRLWFRGKFVAVRTARYDDIFNNIDEIIFDVETHTPLAVVDTTTDLESKLGDPEFLEKLKKGGAIKYGLGLEANGVSKKNYPKLPIFIVSLRADDVRSLADELLKGGPITETSVLLERVIVQELRMQSDKLGMHNNIPKFPENIRQGYIESQTVFDHLAA